MEKKNIFGKDQVVTILTDQPINGGLLDYLVPDNSYRAGQFVEIHLGRRSCVGVIWSEGSNKIAIAKLKSIDRKLDIQPMSNELKIFLIKVAKYTINPLNKVFKLSLGALDLKYSPKGTKFFKVGNPKLPVISSKRKKILKLLSQTPNKLFTIDEITSSASVSVSLVNELAKIGMIKPFFVMNFLFMKGVCPYSVKHFQKCKKKLLRNSAA